MPWRIRKSEIKKDEIIADAIFLLISFIISFVALYLFDIHWNFYPGGKLFPLKDIYFTIKVYISGAPC